MKLTAAITIAAITLAACTDAELISTAKGQCDTIGYAVGSPEYTQCVERGFRGTRQAQDEAIAATVASTAVWAIFNAF